MAPWLRSMLSPTDIIWNRDFFSLYWLFLFWKLLIDILPSFENASWLSERTWQYRVLAHENSNSKFFYHRCWGTCFLQCRVWLIATPCSIVISPINFTYTTIFFNFQAFRLFLLIKGNCERSDKKVLIVVHVSAKFRCISCWHAILCDHVSRSYAPWKFCRPVELRRFRSLLKMACLIVFINLLPCLLLLYGQHCPRGSSHFVFSSKVS